MTERAAFPPVVPCWLVGGMIAVDSEDAEGRERQVELAVKNIRDGIVYGLEAQDG